MDTTDDIVSLTLNLDPSFPILFGIYFCTLSISDAKGLGFAVKLPIDVTCEKSESDGETVTSA